MKYFASTRPSTARRISRCVWFGLFGRPGLVSRITQPGCPAGAGWAGGLRRLWRGGHIPGNTSSIPFLFRPIFTPASPQDSLSVGEVLFHHACLTCQVCHRNMEGKAVTLDNKNRVYCTQVSNCDLSKKTYLASSTFLRNFQCAVCIRTTTGSSARCAPAVTRPSSPARARRGCRSCGRSARTSTWPASSARCPTLLSTCFV